MSRKKSATLLGPRPKRGDLGVEEKVWGIYTYPCRLIRLDFTNLLVRKKADISFLITHGIQAADHLGALDSMTLHRLFGVGRHLGRSMMQMMDVAGLIEPSGGPSPDLRSHEGHLFSVDDTARADHDNEYDHLHTLTEEGRRLAATGIYEKVVQEDRTVFVLEPGGLIRSSQQFNNALGGLDWKSEDQISLEEVASWFEGPERVRRKVPDDLVGPLLEERTILNDFKQPEGQQPVTNLRVSTSTPRTDRGIWVAAELIDDRLPFHGGKVVRESYWMMGKSYSIPSNPTGGRWTILPQEGWELKGFVPDQVELVDSGNKFELVLDLESEDHLVPSDDETRLTVIGINPGSPGAELQFEATPVPHASRARDWVLHSLDRMSIKVDGALDRATLETILKTRAALLHTTWRSNDRDQLHINIEDLCSADSFLDDRLSQGDWLIKYRIEEQEVFSRAL